MTATELPAEDWRRSVYGRSQIGGNGVRRQPRRVDRERIIAQQGYVCLYCEIPISTKIWRKAREVILCAAWDHFVPYAYSQRNPAQNWVLACHVCNGIKTARMFADVETARRAILPERIAKGYEAPEDVFHRLGLQRQHGVLVLQAQRPTDGQLEALQAFAVVGDESRVAERLGISVRALQSRLLGAARRLGAMSTAEAIEIARLNYFITDGGRAETFDGCNRECRKAGEHTLRWGGCELATEPEPGVTIMRMRSMVDGAPGLVGQRVTISELALVIEDAIRTVSVNLGPNALALLQRGETVGLSGSEYAAMAEAAATAIAEEPDEAISPN